MIDVTPTPEDWAQEATQLQDKVKKAADSLNLFDDTALKNKILNATDKKTAEENLKEIIGNIKGVLRDLDPDVFPQAKKTEIIDKLAALKKGLEKEAIERFFKTDSVKQATRNFYNKSEDSIYKANYYIFAKEHLSKIYQDLPLADLGVQYRIQGKQWKKHNLDRVISDITKPQTKPDIVPLLYQDKQKINNPQEAYQLLLSRVRLLEKEINNFPQQQRASIQTALDNATAALDLKTGLKDFNVVGKSPAKTQNGPLTHEERIQHHVTGYLKGQYEALNKALSNEVGNFFRLEALTRSLEKVAAQAGNIHANNPPTFDEANPAHLYHALSNLKNNFARLGLSIQPNDPFKAVFGTQGQLDPQNLARWVRDASQNIPFSLDNVGALIQEKLGQLSQCVLSRFMESHIPEPTTSVQLSCKEALRLNTVSPDALRKDNTVTLESLYCFEHNRSELLRKNNIQAFVYKNLDKEGSEDLGQPETPDVIFDDDAGLGPTLQVFLKRAYSGQITAPQNVKAEITKVIKNGLIEQVNCLAHVGGNVQARLQAVFAADTLIKELNRPNNKLPPDLKAIWEYIQPDKSESGPDVTVFMYNFSDELIGKLAARKNIPDSFRAFLEKEILDAGIPTIVEGFLAKLKNKDAFFAAYDFNKRRRLDVITQAMRDFAKLTGEQQAALEKTLTEKLQETNKKGFGNKPLGDLEIEMATIVSGYKPDAEVPPLAIKVETLVQETSPNTSLQDKVKNEVQTTARLSNELDTASLKAYLEQPNSNSEYGRLLFKETTIALKKIMEETPDKESEILAAVLNLLKTPGATPTQTSIARGIEKKLEEIEIPPEKIEAVFSPKAPKTGTPRTKKQKRARQ